MDCITSRKQELQNDSDDPTFTWTATGEPLLKKHKIRGRLPLTTEEFRLWMRIMRHHWGVVRVRHSDKPALAGLNAEFWENYTEYMLSEECRGYGVKDEGGRMEAQISWRAFLTYEQEVRNRSIKWVNELGLTICEATKRAMADNELRTKYLVSALAIQRAATPGGGTKRTFDQFHEEADNVHGGGKGKGDKGGWKGHDKDKGKKGGRKKGKGGKEKRKANNAAARGPNYRFKAC